MYISVSSLRQTPDKNVVGMTRRLVFSLSLSQVTQLCEGVP